MSGDVVMRDFIMLMHDDALAQPSPDQWAAYFSFLRSRDAFDGGSAIGPGETFRKQGVPAELSGHLGGYIRVRAGTLGAARELLCGNPVFDCGGTVEIRELPRD
jgi:hypothetical protein